MDLWPDDINKPDDNTAPSNILKEQAKILENKTDGIVTALVNRIESNEKQKFEYSFLIYSSILNYRYRLFNIIHGILLFPVQFLLDGEIYEELTGKKISFFDSEDEFFANSEDEFIELLKKILNCGKTKKIIGTLLKLSSEENFF